MTRIFSITKFHSLLSIVMLIGLVQCRTTAPVVPETVLEPARLENALLWRISGNGLAQPSYLYGTIHMIPAADFFLPEGTLPALDTATVLYLEIDMSKLEDPAEQLKMMTQSFMADDIGLRDLLPEADYNLVKDHFSRLGLPIFFLERIKPMFLSVFADERITPSALSDGTFKVYELEFTGLAESGGMPVRGLETIEFQLALMDSIPYEDQAQMLVESIRAEQEGQAEYDSLVQIYVRQDLNAMIEGFDADSLAGFENLLLTNRNNNWIPVMEKAMQDSSCFFAVGAAHLGGANGVITLLRNEGYLVRPVK
jgi:uncharacterized protein YbaP (TraB family)